MNIKDTVWTNKTYAEFLDYLKSISDERYKSFHKK